MTAVFWRKPGVRLAILFISFLLAWQCVGGGALFPTPLQIIGAMEGALLSHAAASLARTGLALVTGCAVGLLAGIAVGESEVADRIVGPPMAFLMPVPGLALAPLFMVLFGFGNRTIVAVGVLAAFFPTAYNTAAGLKAVPQEPTEAAALDGAGWLQALRYVKLPLALPMVATGVKLSAARCWRTVIAVEFVAAANRGLGYFIWDSAEYLRSDRVMGGIVALALVYLAFSTAGRYVKTLGI